ncbi:MAG: hypothetical protein CM15mP77_0550 [Synechococcus sp.]|nr:MAG: hypothetical protein CM15mP77_0550 [Synechococcus sp.]
MPVGLQLVENVIRSSRDQQIHIAQRLIDLSLSTNGPHLLLEPKPD